MLDEALTETVAATDAVCDALSAALAVTLDVTEQDTLTDAAAAAVRLGDAEKLAVLLEVVASDGDDEVDGSGDCEGCGDGECDGNDERDGDGGGDKGAALDDELSAALDAIPEFRNQADTAEVMSKGKLQGYSIEVKPRIVQIDWNFATESLNLRFAEQVFHTLNPHLARKAALRCQVFHRRIDILSDGFVPKAELAHHVADWVQNTRLAPAGGNTTQLPECIVLGDELYDDYLFQSIKTLKPKVFGHVRCIGVRNGNTALFQHADKVVESPDEAWELIDNELKGSR
jgi:hypothetical protein